MSKLVEMTRDVYPHGCVGDVVRLKDKVIAELDKRKDAPVYRLWETTAAARVANAEEAEVVEATDADAEDTAEVVEADADEVTEDEVTEDESEEVVEEDNKKGKKKGLFGKK